MKTHFDLVVILFLLSCAVFACSEKDEEDDDDAGPDTGADTDVDTDADSDTDTDTDDDAGPDASPDLAPTLEIEATPLFGRSELEVTFSANGAGGDGTLSYSWEFGDGDTSTEQNPTHTFVDFGDYSPSCTVADEDGDEDSASVDIEVRPALARTFTETLDAGLGGPCGHPWITRTGVLDETDAGVFDAGVELTFEVDGGAMIDSVIEGTALTSLPAKTASVMTSSSSGIARLGLTVETEAGARVAAAITDVTSSDSMVDEAFELSVIGDCCEAPIDLGDAEDNPWTTTLDYCDFHQVEEMTECAADGQSRGVFQFHTSLNPVNVDIYASVNGSSSNVSMEVRDVTGGCPGTPVPEGGSGDTCFSYSTYLNLPDNRTFIIIVTDDRTDGSACGETYVSLYAGC